MDKTLALIRYLGDGQWHSGEDLAAVLGVSRAAVWKRLKGFEDYGLELDSQAGKGYRLKQPLELLDEKKIRVGDEKVIVLTEIDSTNRYLSDLSAGRELHSPAICFAEYQSAGRGRRGRQWNSPFGANIYCSLLWRFNEMPPDLPALSLAVGISLAECLAKLKVKKVGLKWPNDLVSGGRKLGGILIEHRGEAGGPCQVIVGVGLNYAMSPTQAASVDQPWVSFCELAKAVHRHMPSRNRLAHEINSALLSCLTQFDEQGFSAFRERWPRYDVACGQPIRIEYQGRWEVAKALGIDRDGALLVMLRGEKRRFMSGDISLRLGEKA